MTLRLSLAGLAVLSSTLLTACPLGCAVDGQDNAVYARGGDTMMVCSNGGFVVLGETEMIEGRIGYEPEGGYRGAVGDTGALAFTTFAEQSDLTWSSPQLGAGWTKVELESWDLDHANVLCSDLEARAWWPNATTLPEATTFVNGLDSIALEPNGALTLRRGNASDRGSYSIATGHVDARLDDGTTFTATYGVDGTLRFEGGMAGSYSRVEGPRTLAH